jgi:hypothetical protein
MWLANHRPGAWYLLPLAWLIALSAPLLAPLSAQAATLTLTKEAPASVPTGATFEYRLSYSCTAVTQGENCLAASVTDVMPAGVEIVSCLGNAAHQQLPGGVSCLTGLNRTASFYFSQSPQSANAPGTLPAGSTGTLVIQAKFTAGSTPNGSQAINYATIRASNATTVNSNFVTTTATATDQLYIAKARLAANSAKGQETAYQVSV